MLWLTERIGDLPDDLFIHWKNSANHYTPEKKLYNCQLGGIPEGGKPHMPERMSMEESFDQYKPDLGEDEARTVKELLRWILQYDPAKRPSAAEILSHPWFRE